MSQGSGIAPMRSSTGPGVSSVLLPRFSCVFMCARVPAVPAVLWSLSCWLITAGLLGITLHSQHTTEHIKAVSCPEPGIKPQDASPGELPVPGEVRALWCGWLYLNPSGFVCTTLLVAAGIKFLQWGLLPVMLQAGPCSSSCHPQMCSRVWHYPSGTLERLHGNHHGAGTNP